MGGNMVKKIVILSESIGETEESNSSIVDELPEGTIMGEKPFCAYAGGKYAHGAYICHEGWIYECTQHGIWLKRNMQCLNED
jgi:hypothetical protein